MTAQLKHSIISGIITITSSLILMAVGLYASGIIDEKKEMRIKLDRKLDKVEFDRHCLENSEQIKSINESHAAYIKEQNVIQNDFLVKLTKISTDIEWIKLNTPEYKKIK